jgi:hypothetical protein
MIKATYYNTIGDHLFTFINIFKNNKNIKDFSIFLEKLDLFEIL